ncbi:hypothetical protein Pelo_424 [Pelomyxa schiedti]|nr:hypothetical protein Pelo_424 [Pelomyxa schiedti]
MESRGKYRPRVGDITRKKIRFASVPIKDIIWLVTLYATYLVAGTVLRKRVSELALWPLHSIPMSTRNPHIHQRIAVFLRYDKSLGRLGVVWQFEPERFTQRVPCPQRESTKCLHFRICGTVVDFAGREDSLLPRSVPSLKRFSSS